MEPLLPVNQAGELAGTTAGFPRRLIAKQRVTFVHVSRPVAIPLPALKDFIQAVAPSSPRGAPVNDPSH